ncbi:MAG: hypothetical protein JO005_11600 [Gammaproteobacteria bacterium]|nr:hypothetical protein [Gammaproteobacteria bacterium]
MKKVRVLALLGALLVTTTELVALDYYTAKLAARSPAHPAQVTGAAVAAHGLTREGMATRRAV